MKNQKRLTTNFAVIYFGKKTAKKPYDTAAKAFFDHEREGCIGVELFNERGILLSSFFPKK